MPKPPSEHSTAVPAAEVRAHLAAILESPPFRTSKRCQDFLTFVVERSLEGATESLREKAIGVAVFGREQAYDTHEDAIVRVTANEVRRRLAQHYQETGGGAAIRIEMPPGSYVPEIRRAAVTPEASREGRWRKFAVSWWSRVVAAGVVLTAMGVWIGTRPSARDRFWAPAFEAPGVIDIQLGQSHAYQLSRRVQDSFLRKHPEYLKNLTPYILIPTPDLDIGTEDIVPVSDLYVSVADALALARLGAFLREREREYRLHLPGWSAAPVTQRGALSILVGAFSNPYTIQTTRDLRFRYSRSLTGEGAIWMIEDTRTGKSWKLVNVFPRQQTDTDYALVTRLLDAGSRRVTLAFGGLTQYGTEGATEILADPHALGKLDEYLGRGWEKKNVQFVIEMRVAGATPLSPKIVMAHAW